MRSVTRKLFTLALVVQASGCDAATKPEAYDLTGFWSGTTTYSTDPSCAMLACFLESRMMIVQNGASVEGWYRFRTGIPGDETPFVGSVRGDTLSVLINSAQVNLVGTTRFRILPGGTILEATNNGNTLRFTLEE